MIKLAQSSMQPMKGPQYTARVSSVGEAKPSAMQKFKGILADKATNIAMEQGEQFAKPYLEAGIDKLSGMFSGSSAPAATELASNLAAQGVAPASYMGGTTATGAGVGSLTGAAGSGAAGAGMMAGIGTAMPYIGAGLLAGKALGFFNKGGAVGPLHANQGQRVGQSPSLKEQLQDKLMIDEFLTEKAKEATLKDFIKLLGPQYKSDGGYLQGPLALRKIRYKQDGGKMEVEATMGE